MKKVYLFHALGRLQTEGSYFGVKKFINLRNYTPGMYHIKLTNEGDDSFSNKSFIIQ